MARGRPRKFDRNVALHRAMEVFWEKGYEGSQLTDLTTAMEINPPSFYAAFGSKEEAFREALELYEREMIHGWVEAFREGFNTRQAIMALLDYTVDVALAAPGPGGCMMVMSMINAMPGSERLRELLQDRWRAAISRIFGRLERGIRDGDLPASTNIARLTTFIGAIVQAISLQARDGATRDELNDIVVSAMMAMPGPEDVGGAVHGAIPTYIRKSRANTDRSA